MSKYICSFNRICKNEATIFIRIESVIFDEEIRIRPYCNLHIGTGKYNYVTEQDYSDYLNLLICKKVIEI